MKHDRFLGLYRIAYAIGFVFFLPFFAWTAVVRRKPQNIWKRLFPSVDGPIPGSGPIVWIHAVSVGEVHAIAPVIEGLRSSNPNARFIISTTTHTGQSTAKKVLPYAAAHLFMPFDFAFSVRRVFRLGAPSLVLFSEGDVWPCFMNEARRRGAALAIVNGKISSKTAQRLQWWPPVGRWLYSFIDLFCLQSEEMACRFRSIGVPESLLRVTGSTKADVSVRILTQNEKQALRSSFGLSSGERVIVLGSTHDGEEEGIITGLESIIRARSDVRLVVVPRHPERFSIVVDRLHTLVPATARLSAYSGDGPWSVMVVDRLGLLTQLYQIASVAIVCGSFVQRVGGHNILEPAAVSVPTIVGPYMHSQQMLFESAEKASAVLAATYETLPQIVAELLDSREAWDRASMAASTWVHSLRGATERTVLLLSQLKNW